LTKYAPEIYLGAISEKESKCLELLSKEVFNGIRVNEILLFRLLIENSATSLAEIDDVLFHEFGIRSSNETWLSAISNINLRFVRESNGGSQVPAGEKYGLDLVELVSGEVVATGLLKTFLANDMFSGLCRDLAKAAELVYRRKFSSTTFKDGFLLYERYSRKDVFRILNWKENPVAQNVGGYMMNSDKKDLAIFVTYHKDEEISDSIKYEERFLSNSIFEWMSKNRRSLNSPEIAAIRNHTTMRIPLFVKKSDSEGTEFYFLGDMKPIEGTFKQAKIKGSDNRDVSAVTIHFNLETPVEENLYSYLTRV
jgi:hypothetical protein